MKKEKWVPAYNFPMYEASSDGNIRNKITGRILKTQINEHGYKALSLRKDGKSYSRTVHKIIAESFHGGEHPGLDVNHKDTNKLNNRSTNLEWCTRQENILHAMKMGVYHENDYGRHRKKIRVRETGEIYNSLNECERETGMDHSEISKYLSGKIKHPVKGYTFEIVD